MDCMIWEYDGSSELLLTHANAAFNCCPEEILADYTYKANTIHIYEGEILVMGRGCRCRCLYNIDYQIQNIQPGEYPIVIVGMYLYGMEFLTCTINLPDEPASGECCVEREGSVWGEIW